MNQRWLPTFFFENALEDFFNSDRDTFRRESSGISLYEDDKSIIVEAAVPGIKAEHIDISLDKGILWIRGESKEEKKDVKYHVKASARFSYQVPLPKSYNEAVAPEAEVKDGILKITFAKTKETKAKKIEVKKK